MSKEFNNLLKIGGLIGTLTGLNTVLFYKSGSKSVTEYIKSEAVDAVLVASTIAAAKLSGLTTGNDHHDNFIIAAAAASEQTAVSFLQPKILETAGEYTEFNAGTFAQDVGIGFALALAQTYLFDAVENLLNPVID